jgi:soluble lytic murein transglycosylase-like protein
MIDLAIIKAIIIIEAMKQGFDPNIALAVAKVESHFNPGAVGSIGEIGLFQVRPEFASISKEKLFDPSENAREGIHQLIYWQKRFPSNYLDHYNSGRHPHSNKYGYKVLKVVADGNL